jgi:predicted membrane protein
MNEFWGLVLFATFIALAAAFAVAIVYCGCVTACHYWNKRQTSPLSSAENQV